ncbi:MAG: hypothetical protein JO099_01550, partial [Acidobacteriia bacterium]|nr:hypothetical protein [Terriglobia bacterium]
MRRLYLPFILAAAAPAATLFMGTYQDSLLVFDESKAQVVDTIKLNTGLPNSLRLSSDKKTLYVMTG